MSAEQTVREDRVIEPMEYLQPVRLGVMKKEGLEERLVYGIQFVNVEGREEFQYFPRLVNGVPFKDELQSVSLDKIDYIKRVQR